MPASTSARPEGPDEEMLTLGELSERVAMSVRNIRFYTSKGLLPPPIRRGRVGYYTEEHVARLELVEELQSQGFTLAAIEKYMRGIPEHASASDIALHRSMLEPWMAETPVEMSRADLERRAGGRLTDEDLATLHALGIVFPHKKGFQVVVSQLTVGLGLLELGYPTKAAVAANEIYTRHGREIAEELYELFRTQVWPNYKESGVTPERLSEIVARLKPLSIAQLVLAYESAMDEAKREGIARRTRRTG